MIILSWSKHRIICSWIFFLCCARAFLFIAECIPKGTPDVIILQAHVVISRMREQQLIKREVGRSKLYNYVIMSQPITGDLNKALPSTYRRCPFMCELMEFFNQLFAYSAYVFQSIKLQFSSLVSLAIYNTQFKFH